MNGSRTPLRHLPANYFRGPGLLWGVASVLILTIGHLGCYYPDLVPYGRMGPAGRLYQYVALSNPMILQALYHGLLAVHLIEGLVALKLCVDCGITDGATRAKWFAQTLVCGITSLRHLIAASSRKAAA